MCRHWYFFPQVITEKISEPKPRWQTPWTGLIGSTAAGTLGVGGDGVKAGQDCPQLSDERRSRAALGIGWRETEGFHHLPTHSGVFRPQAVARRPDEPGTTPAGSWWFGGRRPTTKKTGLEFSFRLGGNDLA